MKNLIKFLLLFFWFLSPVVLAHGNTSEIEPPEDVVERLQNRYDNIQSLSFNFHQDTSGEMTGRPRSGSGKGMFYRDDDSNYMRWDYTSPDTQVLFSDGTSFSMYFSKLQQMIVSPAERLDADLTYSFFTGKGKLKRDFHIRPADEKYQPIAEAGFKIVKLIPKTPQSQVQNIHVWVTDNSLIRRIQILDHFGTITVLNLSDIEIDSLTGKGPQKLKKLFSFEPPEGTEIIQQ